MQRFLSKVFEPFNDLRRTISRAPAVGKNAGGDQHRDARRGATTNGSEGKRQVKPSVVSLTHISRCLLLGGGRGH